MGNALIFADGPPEHDPFAGIGGGIVERAPGHADAGRSDKDALIPEGDDAFPARRLGDERRIEKAAAFLQQRIDAKPGENVLRLPLSPGGERAGDAVDHGLLFGCQMQLNHDRQPSFQRPEGRVMPPGGEGQAARLALVCTSGSMRKRRAAFRPSTLRRVSSLTSRPSNSSSTTRRLIGKVPSACG